jgi:hypothetical protein
VIEGGKNATAPAPAFFCILDQDGASAAAAERLSIVAAGTILTKRRGDPDPPVRRPFSSGSPDRATVT